MSVVCVGVGSFGWRALYHFYTILADDHELLPHSTLSDTCIRGAARFFSSHMAPRALVVLDLDHIWLFDHITEYSTESELDKDTNETFVKFYDKYLSSNCKEHIMECLQTLVESCNEDLDAFLFFNDLSDGFSAGLTNYIIQEITMIFGEDVYCHSASLFVDPVRAEPIECLNEAFALWKMEYVLNHCVLFERNRIDIYRENLGLSRGAFVAKIVSTYCSMCHLPNSGEEESLYKLSELQKFLRNSYYESNIVTVTFSPLIPSFDADSYHYGLLRSTNTGPIDFDMIPENSVIISRSYQRINNLGFNILKPFLHKCDQIEMIRTFLPLKNHREMSVMLLQTPKVEYLYASIPRNVELIIIKGFAAQFFKDGTHKIELSTLTSYFYNLTNTKMMCHQEEYNNFEFYHFDKELDIESAVYDYDEEESDKFSESECDEEASIEEFYLNNLTEELGYKLFLKNDRFRVIYSNALASLKSGVRISELGKMEQYALEEAASNLDLLEDG